MAPKYPAIPSPTAEVHALRSSSLAVKETVEILTRQRGVPSRSAVTFEDLVTMGVITSSQFPTALGGDPKPASGTPPAAPTVTPPPPAMLLLETITFAGAASYASSVSWAGYNHIKLIISNLVNAAVGNTPYVELHSAGAYQNANYASGSSVIAMNGATPAFTAALGPATAGILLYGSTDLIAADVVDGFSAEATLFNIASTTVHKHLQSIGLVRVTATNYQYVSFGGGQWGGGTTAIDGLRLKTTPGTNINSGTMEIYGIL